VLPVKKQQLTKIRISQAVLARQSHGVIKRDRLMQIKAVADGSAQDCNNDVRRNGLPPNL
jgi:hypothetical protein